MVGGWGLFCFWCGVVFFLTFIYLLFVALLNACINKNRAVMMHHNKTYRWMTVWAHHTVYNMKVFIQEGLDCRQQSKNAGNLRPTSNYLILLFSCKKCSFENWFGAINNCDINQKLFSLLTISYCKLTDDMICSLSVRCNG